jgi:hypothetical protein
MFWVFGGSLYLGMLGYEYFLIEPLKSKLLNEFMDKPGQMT